MALSIVGIVVPWTVAAFGVPAAASVAAQARSETFAKPYLTGSEARVGAPSSGTKALLAGSSK